MNVWCEEETPSQEIVRRFYYTCYPPDGDTPLALTSKMMT